MRTLLSGLLLSFFAIPHQTLAIPQPSPQQQKPKLPTWTLTPTSSTQQFRGLFPIAGSRHNSHNQHHTIWLSGTNGTVLLSTNTGSTWTNVSPNLAPENATNFQFRDIHAWDSKRAAVLSIGEGNLSRVYVTSDSGKTWKQTFVNEEESAFYDCMAFESGSSAYGDYKDKNSKHGIAMSDPVNGKFRLLETWDGGDSWSILPSDNMTPALPGEFGFAASGTCIEARQGHWYIATGGVDPGRILRSSDGRTWSASDSSIAGGAAAGVFSVRFRDGKVGVAVGGDFEKPTQNVNNSAFSVDGGRSWTRSSVFPGGYRSGVSWVPGRRNTAIAVGTSGSDVTFDGGRTWFGLGNDSFDAVECVDGGVCWGSGARGRVGMLVF